MKFLLFVCCLILAINFSIFSQTVKHHSYTTHYNPIIKVPDSVSYDLTPEMVLCNKPEQRIDKFSQDPDIPNSALPKDYKVNKGVNRKLQIDAGHLFNYEDAACDSIDRIECFYMSNMLPQYHSFNAGDWKTLETQERKWAKITPIRIITGGLGSLGALPAGENIPAYMWKAIYLNGSWRAWIMPNKTSSKSHKYTYWEIPITDLIRQTGLKI